MKKLLGINSSATSLQRFVLVIAITLAMPVMPAVTEPEEKNDEISLLSNGKDASMRHAVALPGARNKKFAADGKRNVCREQLINLRKIHPVPGLLEPGCAFGDFSFQSALHYRVNRESGIAPPIARYPAGFGCR